MKGIIYCYQQKENGKCYIGLTTNEKERKRSHIKAAFKENVNNKFYNALRKYGIDSFEYSIIETIEADTKQELMNLLNEREILIISQYDSVLNGYNICSGGGGSAGHIVSDETKKKLSEAAKGHKHNLGRKHSEESKELIRMKKIGIKATEETKLKQSINGKIAKELSAVPILQLDLEGNLVMEHKSLTEATLSVGKSKGNISSCCTGKRETAYNFKWQYKTTI